MHHDGEAEIDATGPKRVPVLVMERRQLAGPDARQMGADEPLLGSPFELGDDGVHVDTCRRITHEEQAVRRRPEGVGQPTVVGADAGGHDVLRVRRYIAVRGRMARESPG